MKQKARKDTSKEGSTQYKRSIVSVLVHPFYPNYICVMQEAGDIHIVDATNGTIAYEYVAKAKVNSNWAVDKINQRVFVVGDVGKACLYDISFLNASFSKFAKMDDNTFDTDNQSPPGKNSYLNKSPNNISPTRKQN